jgi:hypothetical protein
MLKSSCLVADFPKIFWGCDRSKDGKFILAYAPKLGLIKASNWASFTPLKRPPKMRAAA